MDCPICLEKLDNKFVNLNCNHTFHKLCIERWSFEHKTCPYCRAIMDYSYNIKMEYFKNKTLHNFLKTRVSLDIEDDKIIVKKEHNKFLSKLGIYKKLDTKVIDFIRIKKVSRFYNNIVNINMGNKSKNFHFPSKELMINFYDSITNNINLFNKILPVSIYETHI